MEEINVCNVRPPPCEPSPFATLPAEIARKDEGRSEATKGERVLSRGATTMQMRETVCTGAFARPGARIRARNVTRGNNGITLADMSKSITFS